MNWILCGFKGCGKSHFGSRLDKPFIDTDQLITQKTGKTPYEIARDQGMEHFRELEKKTVLSLHPQNTVIAIGGGTLLDPENAAHLQSLGPLCYLYRPLSELIKQLPSYQPSFLDSEEKLKALFSVREPLYSKLATHTFDLSNQSEEDVLALLQKTFLAV